MKRRDDPRDTTERQNLEIASLDAHNEELATLAVLVDAILTKTTALQFATTTRGLLNSVYCCNVLSAGQLPPQILQPAIDRIMVLLPR